MDYQALQQRLAEMRVQAARLPDADEIGNIKARILRHVSQALEELNRPESSSRRLRAVPPPLDIPGPDPDDLRSLVVIMLPGREPSVIRA